MTREFELDDLRCRLAEIAARLPANLDVQTIVADTRPVNAILDAIESLPADLIVLITHAHPPGQSSYDPSIGQRLLRHPNLMRLLIRSEKRDRAPVVGICRYRREFADSQLGELPMRFAAGTDDDRTGSPRMEVD